MGVFVDEATHGILSSNNAVSNSVIFADNMQRNSAAVFSRTHAPCVPVISLTFTAKYGVLKFGLL